MLPIDIPLALMVLAGGALGAIVGSFVAALVMRWPRGESVVGGRSRCDSCGGTLRAGELVPVLSYLMQFGRCRRCGVRIDPKHPAIELAGALIGVVSVLAHPLPLALVTAGFAWWLLAVAAIDAEEQWLPDALTLPLVPLGLLAAWAGLGPPLLDRALGAVVGGLGLALLAWIYRALRGREGMGGGDPKLLAGIGAWLGVLQLPFVLLGAGLVGIVAALAMTARGQAVGAATRLPLGSLMAVAAWPLWILVAGNSSAAIHLYML
ncbi:MAG: prepilin peptidase [Allosphingosinicella sp.]|uniref:prepilin peptidase n=1 Tax=Allosphingosinicella sp. TaxID=2823234 RepID=UPI00394DFC7D